MRNIITAAASAYNWWQSLGPVGLAVEFLAIVGLVSSALWGTCRNRSPVFWKRTDYAYFLFAILGGTAAVADIAVNSWTKQAEQIRANIINETIRMQDYLSTASLFCDKQKEQDKERAKRGRVVIDPDSLGLLIGESGFRFGELHPDECPTIAGIVEDIRNNRLKDVVLYDPEYKSRDDRTIIGFGDTPFDDVFIDNTGKMRVSRRQTPLMRLILLGVSQIADERAKQFTINEQLSSLSYLSILKSLSPLLLGLGIGIRLARTHHDVKAEERKAVTEANVATS